MRVLSKKTKEHFKNIIVVWTNAIINAGEISYDHSSIPNEKLWYFRLMPNGEVRLLHAI